MTTAEEDAKAAARKEAHRRSMAALGWIWVVAGLAAGYLVVTTGRRVPGFLFGRAGGADAALDRGPERYPAAKPLVDWTPFSRAALERAKAKDDPVLLSVWAFWSRPCRAMDRLTYSDPEAAKLAAARAVPIRVDADARPDLARRYLGAGWPTTAVLVPSTGQILDSGTFMTPEVLRAWLSALADGYAARKERVEKAAAGALEEAAQGPARAAAPRARDELDGAREALTPDFDEASAGFGRGPGPRFPFFRRIAALASLESEPWAQALAARAARGTLRLEDPAWGGFFRCAAGPAWARVEPERRLEDQADAVAALARLEPEAAARALSFVAEFLSDPRGGYYAAQAPEVALAGGEVLDGRAYYSKDDAGRRALGLPAVDRRVFFGSSARMAEATLDAPASLAGPVARKQAVRALERLWAKGVSGGLAAHELGGGPLKGLLEDQLAGVEAFTAAAQAGQGKVWVSRARELAAGTERSLMDPKTGALFDRPALGELPDALDRAFFPDLQLSAWRAYGRLARVLPLDDPWRARLLARRESLAAWLWARAGQLDPADRAVLALDGKTP